MANLSTFCQPTCSFEPPPLRLPPVVLHLRPGARARVAKLAQQALRPGAGCQKGKVTGPIIFGSQS